MANPKQPQPERKASPAAQEPPSLPAAHDTKRTSDSAPAPTGTFARLPAKFGRYQVEKLLGRGAMGAVYLAQDMQLERPVALKIPRLSAAGSVKLLARLKTEAKAAAKIDHPSVCHVHDYGEIDDIPFIAMQYIEGETLKEHLQNQAKTQREAVGLVLHLAEGLAEAHARGIYHRDLKPENIKLNRRGVPVIMDFGLAKLTATVSADAGKTQSGTILGSPAYMSPEQAGGKVEEIDHRSDLYSLGVMLFEMLTGQWPFTGAALQVMGQKSVLEPPSPLTVKPELNPQLAAVCHKLIARKREDRYQNAKELIAALKVLDVEPGTLNPGGSIVAGESQASVPAVFASFEQDDNLSSLIARKRQEASRGGAAIKLGNHTQWIAQSIADWWRGTPPRVKWTSLAATILIVGLFSLWAGGVVLSVKAQEGTLVVEVNDAGAAVFIDGERAAVTWDDGKRKTTVQVKPGERRVEVKKDGFSVAGKKITFKDGVREIFQARLDAIPAAKGTAGTLPAARPETAEAVFVPLFNGKNLTDWSPVGNVGSFRWLVEDGVLIARNESKTRGPARDVQLSHKREDFANFHLRFEAQYTGNWSARAIVRFREKGLSYQFFVPGSENQGVELHNFGGLIVPKFGDHPRQGIEAEPSMCKYGEWFTFEIIARDYEFTVHVNSTQVLHYVDDSRRADHGGIRFNIAPGSTFRFRKIEIKEYLAGGVLTPEKSEREGVVATLKSGKSAAQKGSPLAENRPGDERDDNGLNMKLVWCPPGKFTMGSPLSEVGRRFGENQVDVELTKGFWLGKREVTQNEWKQVMATQPWIGEEGVKEGIGYPATFVDWDDARIFCRKLTERERTAGRLPDDWEYALPTEAQWEYACRAGSQTRYTFGDSEGELGNYGWFYKNASSVGEKYAHEVGTKRANAWGLYDMHGNVWEWCEDMRRDQLPGGSDPRVKNAEGLVRVYRGGGWLHDAALCRSAARDGGPQSERFDFLGLRVALGPAFVAVTDSIDRQQFSIWGGKWRVEGNELLQTDTLREFSILMFGDPSWRDYDFTVDAMRVEGRDQFALIFRNGEGRNLYLAHVGWSVRSGEGFVVFQNPDSYSPIGQKYNFPIENHHWYKFRIRVRGDHVQCFLSNGEQETKVSDLTDNRYPNGRVGLRVVKSAYRFKNIKVTAPNGKVLWEGMPALP